MEMLVLDKGSLTIFYIFLDTVLKMKKPPATLSNTITQYALKNKLVRQTLLEMDALPKYDKQKWCFIKPWNIESVKNVIAKINQHCMMIRSDFHPAMGHLVMLLSERRYLQVGGIVNQPKIFTGERLHFMENIHSYIVQQIKLWGCHSLHATNIQCMINTSTDHSEAYKNSISSASEACQCKPQLIPVSRIDIITYLMGSSDCIVQQNLLKVLAKFSMAMPLIICDIYSKRYIIMLPLLRDIIIRWETAIPGTIIENNLFRSPFKLIVAGRLGSNGRSSGKSIILNQLLKAKYLFSCRGEPGGKIFGKPCTLDGSVEFIWLVKETCEDGLWRELFETHYSKGQKELILLANMHGDLVNNMEHMNFFQSMSCTFLVFIMSSVTEPKDQKSKLEKQFSTSGHTCQCIIVDPNQHEEDHADIYTAELQDDETLRKLRLFVTKSLSMAKKTEYDYLKPCSGPLLLLADHIHTKESEAVVELAKNETCKGIKSDMKLQEMISNSNDEKIKFWKTNVKLQKTIKLFMRIFDLPAFETKKAILHMEAELSYLSNSQSADARRDVLCYKEDYRSIKASEHPDKAKLSQIEKCIKDAMNTVDKNNLGTEHFFRELSYIHFFSTSADVDNYKNLPGVCAELLINGCAIELFDGDHSILSVEWLDAILKSVSERVKGIRVFVVSIIGLQSSGKSTLLNALFSCKFAVSIGRCSRGLYMRLVFLDEELKLSQGFDAFLIIDTEGLGSPEKMHDTDAEKKDRMMATFAMGVSDLTIINIFGEAILEMTEILQIAILAMARLGKTDMASDMLVVQHLPERDDSKLSEIKDNFCKALETSFDIAQKKSTDVGVQSLASLVNLMQSIQEGKFLKVFSPLKNGPTLNASPSENYHRDVVDLFESILLISKQTKSKQTLIQWSSIVANYWTCVKNESFALDFKNAKKMVEFLLCENKVAKIREAIECTFRSHRDKIEIELHGKIAESKVFDSTTFLSTKQEQFRNMPNVCLEISTSEQSSTQSCDYCTSCQNLIADILRDVEGKDNELTVKSKIESYIEYACRNTFKILSQTAEALIVKDQLGDEYDAVVNNEIHQLLNINPSCKFDDTMIRDAVDKIWNKLETLASSKQQVERLSTRIEEAIMQNYRQIQNIVNHYRSAIDLKQFYKEKSVDHSGSSRFVRLGVALHVGSKTNLTKLEACTMNSQITAVVKCIFEDSKSDCFEPSMITQLKTSIDKVIETTENELQLQFLANFKVMVHSFTLQQFRNDMNDKQRVWDYKHSPVEILKQKRDDYTKQIAVRLTNGFGAASDGLIVADVLINATENLAKIDIENELCRVVLEKPWTTNADTVRLMYFEELVMEVKAGDKARALKHFSSPAYEINRWYIGKIDKIPSEYAQQKYAGILADKIKSAISALSKRELYEGKLDELSNFIIDYINQAKADFPSNIKITEYKPDQALQFKEKLLGSLARYSNGKSHKPVTFKPPSSDEIVMKRVGCLAYCHFCHSLCWSCSQHDVNIEDKSASQHMTCHQPWGLGGTHSHGREDLRAECCSDYPDEGGIYSKGQVIKWGTLKRECYNEWSFINYPKQEFVQMMRWFFVQLHNNIAEESKCKPAIEDELIKHHCTNLNIDEILISVRNKLTPPK